MVKPPLQNQREQDNKESSAVQLASFTANPITSNRKRHGPTSGQEGDAYFAIQQEENGSFPKGSPANQKL